MVHAIMREKYAWCIHCTSKNLRAHLCAIIPSISSVEGSFEGPGNNGTKQLYLMATFTLWQRLQHMKQWPMYEAMRLVVTLKVWRWETYASSSSLVLLPFWHWWWDQCLSIHNLCKLGVWNCIPKQDECLHTSHSPPTESSLHSKISGLALKHPTNITCATLASSKGGERAIAPSPRYNVVCHTAQLMWSFTPMHCLFHSICSTDLLCSTECKHRLPVTWLFESSL